MAIKVEYAPSAAASGTMAWQAGKRRKHEETFWKIKDEQFRNKEFASRQEQQRLTREHQGKMQEQRHAQQEQMFDRSTERVQDNMQAQYENQQMAAEEAIGRQKQAAAEQYKMASDIEKSQIKKNYSEYNRRKQALIDARSGKSGQSINEKAFQVGMERLKQEYPKVADDVFMAGIQEAESEIPTQEVSGQTVKTLVNPKTGEPDQAYTEFEYSKLYEKRDADQAKTREKAIQTQMKEAEKVVDDQIDAEVDEANVTREQVEGENYKPIDPMTEHRYRLARKRALMGQAQEQIMRENAPVEEQSPLDRAIAEGMAQEKMPEVALPPKDGRTLPNISYEVDAGTELPIQQAAAGETVMTKEGMKTKEGLKMDLGPKEDISQARDLAVEFQTSVTEASKTKILRRLEKMMKREQKEGRFGAASTTLKLILQ